MPSPIIPEVGVIALVPDEWGSMWQSRHHVLSRLARYFQVLWMNPAREWRDILKGTTRSEGRIDCRQLPPGFIVKDAEPWLPHLYRFGTLRKAFTGQRVNRARRQLVRAGCKTIILYLWRADFADALKLVPADLSCYHVDDEYSFSDIETPGNNVERRLIESVDEVFIHSPGLFEKKGNINHHTTLIPNGVDYQLYATPYLEPGDLRHIPHPRIGYAGWLKKQLDWRLLRVLAERHPEWSLVFVGGENTAHKEIATDIAALSCLRNVYFLGSKSTEDLCRYPQHFDVCIMPYVANDYTKYIYPLKLHEYLACGRPVVGTRIRSLEQFSAVIGLASTPDEWHAAIAWGSNRDGNFMREARARQAIAREYDWNVLVKRIAKVLAVRLGDDFVRRLERLTDDKQTVDQREEQ
jgi:glycosyltransferase involved in cell wall biosynthesis